MSALSAHAVDAIRRLAADMPTPQSALLSALRMAQSDAGHVGSAQVQIVAEVLGLTPMQVEGVARFYDLVTREPTAPGRLRLCTGVVCVLRGASAVGGAMAAARGGGPGRGRRVHLRARGMPRPLRSRAGRLVERRIGWAAVP